MKKKIGIIAIIMTLLLTTQAFAYDVTKETLESFAKPYVTEDYRNVYVEQIPYSKIVSFTDAMIKQSAKGLSNYLIVSPGYGRYSGAVTYLYLFDDVSSATYDGTNYSLRFANVIEYRLAGNYPTWTWTDEKTYGSNASISLWSKGMNITSSQKMIDLVPKAEIARSDQGNIAFYRVHAFNGSVYYDSVSESIKHSAGENIYNIDKYTGKTMSLSNLGDETICLSNFDIYNELGQKYYIKDSTLNWMKTITLYKEGTANQFTTIDFKAYKDTKITVTSASSVQCQNYYSSNGTLIDMRKNYWNTGQTYTIYAGKSIGFSNITSGTGTITIGYDPTEIKITKFDSSAINNIYVTSPVVDPDTSTYNPPSTNPTPTPTNNTGNTGNTGTTDPGGGFGGMTGQTGETVNPFTKTLDSPPNRSSYPEGIIGDVQYGFATVVYYIGLPFRWIAQGLETAVQWLTGAKDWIANVSNFLSVVLSFLPTPIVTGIVMLATVSIVFAIVKAIRG